MYVSTLSEKQSQPAGLVPAGGGDPAPRPSRRVFSPECKWAIVTEYENAPTGE